MKPTQEQILSALNKLIRENKTELKTEKVELESVKELEKYSKLGEAKIKSAKVTIARVKKEQEDLRQHNEDLEKLNDRLDKDLKGFEANAKELGVKATDVPAYNKARDLSISLVKQAEFGYQVLKGKK
jgi:methionine aminopeptidase